MKKQFSTLLLALVMCLTIIPVSAVASEITENVSIKIPGCDAIFTLENVSTQYGIVKGGVPEYIFAMPGENGKVTCDTAALVDLFGEFHGTNPSDSNAGGGAPVFEAGWSYEYNFAGSDGEGVTIVTAFLQGDGSLATEDTSNMTAQITFIMGYPISYGAWEVVQLPDNLIDAAAELRPISELEVGGNAAAPALDTPSSWATEQVNSAIASEIVPVSLQQNYTNPVSRGDVTQMFINLIEQSSGKSIEAFLAAKDVSMDQNAFTDTTDDAVLAAHALGVVSGVGDGRFDPNGTFTRAQIAAIINRIARVLNIDTDGFTHNFNDLSGHWADAELGWPVHAGIISGVGDNRFNPNGQLTTEQAIVIAYRALQYFQQYDGSDAAIITSDPDFLSNKICEEIREYALSVGFEKVEDYTDSASGWMINIYRASTGNCASLGFRLAVGCDHWYYGIATYDSHQVNVESGKIYNIDDMKTLILRCSNY